MKNIRKFPNHEVLGKIAKQKSLDRAVFGAKGIATFPIFPKSFTLPHHPSYLKILRSPRGSLITQP